jgi:hypothetical protein
VLSEFHGFFTVVPPVCRIVFLTQKQAEINTESNPIFHAARKPRTRVSRVSLRVFKGLLPIGRISLMILARRFVNYVVNK